MITTDWNTTEVDESIVADIKAIADIKVFKDHPQLLVFPHSFGEYDNGFGDKCVCEFNEEQQTISTRSILGFVGRNKTTLTIRSRFTPGKIKIEETEVFDESKEDYFLHYMLQKVFGLNIFDMKHTTSKESVFDFSLYLFPHFLKKALRQGVYREYKTQHYNDANVKGTIDVSRHIRINLPFAGNIAYRTREYLHDNDTTQLIRHTIEHIRCHKFGSNILNCDADTRAFISQIEQVTESYQKSQRQSIINRNLKPVRHSLYTAYEPLRKLCLQILRYEQLKYGQKKDEIHGVLFDGAWLWEEYLAIVLKEGFTHYHKEKGKRWYLFDTGQQIIPDYISKDKAIVADAKYIALDKEGNYKNEEKATNIYYKTITYMYRWNAKFGLLLYPIANKDSVVESIHRIVGTESYVIKVGFPIPQSGTFSKFSEMMKMSEVMYLEHCLLKNINLNQINERVKSYLKRLGIKSVRELTDEQLISYYLDECKNTELMFYAEMAFKNFEKGKVISSMRKSMEENVPFYCGYITNESCDGKYKPKEWGWILKP